MSSDTGSHRSDQHAELVSRVQVLAAADLLQHRGRGLDHLFDQFGEQFVLALHVAIESGACQDHRVGDVLKAGAREATSGKQTGGVLKDLVFHKLTSRCP